MSNGLYLDPTNQTVVVSIVSSNSGAALPLFSDINCTVTQANPFTLNPLTPITVYSAAPGSATISMKVNGVELATASGAVLPFLFGDNNSGSAQIVITPASALRLASSTYALLKQGRHGNLVVFLGDSITAGSEDIANQAQGESWANYFSIINAQQARYVRNAGIAGNMTAQVLARFDTDVTPYNPNTVVLLAGTNDTGVTAFSTYQATMTAIVGKIRAIGAVPVLCTLPPNNGATPVNRKQQILLFNGWLRRYAASQGIALVDFYAVLADPATSNYLTGMNSDVTHPNAAGQVLMANAAVSALQSTLLPHSPILCRDDVDENNIIYKGCFTGYSGTTMPTGWFDNAGTPAGTSLSYVTDTAVPGQLFTITAAASAGSRQVVTQLGAGITTMPATAVNATTFSLSINPGRGVLFIGSGSTFEIAKVTSVSGSGPYAVTLTRGTVYAHTAGEQVVVNAAPGDTIAYSGRITSTGGTGSATVGVFCTGGTATIPKAMFNITQALTRGVWYQESVVPVGNTTIAPYLQVGGGTNTVSFGQISVVNLTRMGV